MKVENNIFVTSTCMQHNCHWTNFIIVCDINANKMFVGIRDNGQIKTYSEDSSTNQIIIDWANKE